MTGAMEDTEYVKHLKAGLGHFKHANSKLKLLLPVEHNQVEEHLTSILKILVDARPVIDLLEGPPGPSYGPVGSPVVYRSPPRSPLPPGGFPSTNQVAVRQLPARYANTEPYRRSPLAPPGFTNANQINAPLQSMNPINETYHRGVDTTGNNLKESPLSEHFTTPTLSQRFFLPPSTTGTEDVWAKRAAIAESVQKELRLKEALRLQQEQEAEAAMRRERDALIASRNNIERMQQKSREMATQIQNSQPPIGTPPSHASPAGSEYRPVTRQSSGLSHQENLQSIEPRVAHTSNRPLQASTSKAKSPIAEDDNSIPLNRVETRTVSWAQKLAKQHEEEERLAQLSIPTKSTGASWAGIAGQGVKEEGESKEMSMRVTSLPSPVEHTRTLTTIGRTKPKTPESPYDTPTTPTIPDSTTPEDDSHTTTNGLPTYKSKDPPYGRPEPIADQHRVVFITNPPPGTTMQQISDGIHEGAIVAIRTGINGKTGKQYFGIIFQFAPCATTFLKIIEEENRRSRPTRFGFLANCVRGEPHARCADLHAMDEPRFARRRLTLAAKGLFFNWKKPEIEQFCYERVPKKHVQFVHMYNGGNATICFVEVSAAIVIKRALRELVVTKAEDGKWVDLNVSYSKDPCEAEIRLLTDGNFD